MTTLPQVSPDWLLLRADADDRSRSRDLVREAAALLPAGRHVIHDLGSGSGAMMRWLAPQLPGPQHWVLHDADAAILEHRDPRPVHDRSGRLAAGRPSVEQLGELDVAALADATLVVASALLDVISFAELHTIVDACVELRVPVLFSLTVNGRVELDPPDRLDERFESAFNTHQGRELDGRRLLGPDAAGVAADMLMDAGWRVHAVGTPWKLGLADEELTARWLDGWLDAATEQQPSLGAQAVEYRAQRRAQLAARELRVTVHHEDVLAWPA